MTCGKKMIIRLAIVSPFFLFLACSSPNPPWELGPQTPDRILHHFAGGADDGAEPLIGRPIISGTTIYGMTSEGGSNNVGTIWRMNADGTGFTLLHSFSSAAVDGARPLGLLLLDGSTLYGMVTCENTAYQGTIFSIQTDGTGFQVLHTLVGSEGKWPYDSLVLSGTTLYGAATYGGNDTGPGWVGKGTVFSVNTDGSDFRLLRTFSGGANDGNSPHGSLILSGSILYGTTLWGGAYDGGTVFTMQADGSGFGIVHHFGGIAADGLFPYATTPLSAAPALYGMTRLGGTGGNGTVFAVNTDGTGHRILHDFQFAADDGYGPTCGTLVMSGDSLFGMTTYGGYYGYGTLFRIGTDGTGFQVLRSFAGGAQDGALPCGSLFLSGAALYGMTAEGGSGGRGVIFSLDIPE